MFEYSRFFPFKYSSFEMPERFRVIGKNVLIERDKPKESAGGVYIPEDWRIYGWFGKVLQVGELVNEAKVGERVMFLVSDYTVIPFKDRQKVITRGDRLVAKLVVRNNIEEIHVINNFILIKPDKVEEKKGGVFIPDSLQKSNSGEVIRAGELCKEVKKGDRVYYNSFLAIEGSEGNQPIHIVTEEIILCLTR